MAAYRWFPRRDQGFLDSLHGSMAILKAFAAVLVDLDPADGFGILRSERKLPCPKESIQAAIGFLQLAPAVETTRTQILQHCPFPEASCLLSLEFARSLENAKIMLRLYVPDHSLEAQRELAAYLAFAKDRLGPEMERLIAQDPFLWKTVQAAGMRRKAG